QQHPWTEGQSISGLLEVIGLGKRPVVVELNEQALLPSQFISTILHAGDRVEIVSIVAGG
ncbi:MAG: sulfur carrier protein ThiS, partial [Akkermansia sp.]